MAAILPRPPFDPPTTALPPLPQQKSRRNSGVRQNRRPPLASQTPSKLTIRTPSRPASPLGALRVPVLSPSSSTTSSSTATIVGSLKPGVKTPSNVPKTTPASSAKLSLRTPSSTRTVITGSSPKQLHANSTPSIPTLRNNLSAIRSRKSFNGDRLVRRSVSISAFPQPPPSPHVLGSGRPSFGHSSTSSPQDSYHHDSPDSSSTGTSSMPAAGARRKKPKASTESLRKVFAYSISPSLLNGTGDSVSISAGAMKRGSDGLLSVTTPGHSRTSSAQGSYSTSATTFEDVEDGPVRGRDDNGDSLTDSSDLLNPKETKGNVLVSVRVRPDAAGSRVLNSEGEWMVDGRTSLIAFKGREGGDYYYDNVFAMHDGNERVYDATAKRLVRQVMEGYHGTVFAYGMTGSGKTYSMKGLNSSPGIIPRAITDIFSYIRETPRREYLLRVSYLEIYNEKIYDLLSQDSSSPQAEIKLREDKTRGVYASPLREEIVQSPNQLLRVIDRGDKARRTGETQWNTHSSRSHAVVQIVVESRERTGGKIAGQEDKRAPLVGGVRVSSLSLIDLAGSERAAEDKTRRTEGAHINKSLLTLGNIISRLSGAKDKAGNPIDKDGVHLPYRNSKLTRLLQPALSGTSLISILCTIQLGPSGTSPVANNHTGETLNTLKFASRAKNNIVSHAKKVEEASSTDAASGALLEKYRMEIQDLRSQLEEQTREKFDRHERLLEEKEQQRQDETLLDIQLAETALRERIEHLNRLIISSQSTGVNSGGKFSSLSMHPRLASYGVSERGSRSLRSSASFSTLHSTLRRSGSGVSTGTEVPMTSQREALRSPISVYEVDEEDTIGPFADGEATLQSQLSSLRNDLTVKNRYISTLERRVDQARRSSHSRNSLGMTTANVQHEQALQEKDAIIREKTAEVAKLRGVLEERDRTIAYLRATAARREGPNGLASPAATPTNSITGGSFSSSHIPHPGTVSSITTTTSNSASLSPVEILASPPRPVSPKKSPKKGSNISAPRTGFPFGEQGRTKHRQSVDDLSRMLDQMIQLKVEKGDAVRSATGSVRARHERGKQSRGEVPTVGALARGLRAQRESGAVDADEMRGVGSAL
ncbi:hypothetical protein MMC13_006586 [Lambiella insularis]|nr:hypothetical protein [Lambiella insularis]